MLVFDQNEVGKETGFIQILGLKISSCSRVGLQLVYSVICAAVFFVSPCVIQDFICHICHLIFNILIC